MKTRTGTPRSGGLTDGMLLLLGEMVDRKFTYLSVGLGNRSTVGQFLSLVDGTRTKADELPFELRTSDFESLWARQLLGRLDKDKVEAKARKLLPRTDEKGEERNRLAWYEHPDAPTPAGVELVEAERARLETLRAAIQERLDMPRLVASKAHKGYSSESLPGVGQLYVITGETAQRWKVQPWGARGSHDPMVVGYGKAMALPKENVAAIDISPAQFSAMKEATRDYMERVGAARSASKSEEESVLAPIRRRLADRESQLLAMLEDEMREAVEGKPEEGMKP